MGIPCKFSSRLFFVVMFSSFQCELSLLPFHYDIYIYTYIVSYFNGIGCISISIITGENIGGFKKFKITLITIVFEVNIDPFHAQKFPSNEVTWSFNQPKISKPLQAVKIFLPIIKKMTNQSVKKLHLNTKKKW